MVQNTHWISLSASIISTWPLQLGDHASNLSLAMAAQVYVIVFGEVGEEGLYSLKDLKSTMEQGRGSRSGRAEQAVLAGHDVVLAFQRSEEANR